MIFEREEELLNKVLDKAKELPDTVMVRLARKIMQEVDSRRFKYKKTEIDNLLCKCGHKHSHHTSSYSVNYSAGFCTHNNCDCKNFLIQS